MFLRWLLSGSPMFIATTSAPQRKRDTPSSGVVAGAESARRVYIPMVGYDSVVVGAGSAGCVLAGRLSEVASVLLIEAGPDYAGPDSLPQDLVNGWTLTTSHDWGYDSEPGVIGHRITLPRARVVGGCSATNATFALRGAPADYDSWAEAGLDGWTFEKVLPFFVRLEADADFGSDAWHGARGPIPIRRYGPDELRPVHAATIEGLDAAGIPRTPDHNRPGAVGVGAAPVNTKNGRRISAASAYLDPVRHRDSLHIMAERMVGDVVIKSGRAVGVRTYPDGEIFEADRVIVAAGAYSSPAILMRSGIGDPRNLEPLGINVVSDLRGVGNNLIDHPGGSIDLAYARDLLPGPRFQSVATVRSSLADSDGPDLHIFAAGPVEDPASPTGASFSLATAVMKPRSRGRLRLTSRDPIVAPSIDPGYFREEADLERMVEALELARAAAATPPLRELSGGIEIASALATDRPALTAYARDECWSYHHAVGTCAMGVDPDEGAVVDSGCAVFGVDGLYVVDASVMPDIPAANTNVPTLMIAEKIVAGLLAG